MSVVVVLAGGSPHAHDFDAVRTALVDLVEAAGHTALPAAHPDDAAALLAGADAAVDAIVVDGLWWRMLGVAYDAWRDGHGYSPPPSTREALRAFVEKGGGLVAIHTTSICFDDWPDWTDVVGGGWRWGHSSHPPRGPVTGALVADRAGHPVVAGLPATFGLDDEVYGDLDLLDGIDVLVTARRHPDDSDQAVVWAHRYGAGRVVYDCFGHDAASIHDPANARLITQALDWTLEGVRCAT